MDVISQIRDGGCWRYAVVMVFIATATACSPDARIRPDSEMPAVPAAGATEQPVVREILAQVEDPPGAPGRLLTLVRYTIAPGAELAPHVHPGVQVASIVSGVLAYEVVSGTAVVQRDVDENGVPATEEELVGPTETELRPGDVVIEEGSMLHYGANRTGEPIVILATLLTEGEELAVLPAGSE